MNLLAEKRIKVINGGAQNPKGLTEKTQELVSSLSNEVAISFCIRSHKRVSCLRSRTWKVIIYYQS